MERKAVSGIMLTLLLIGMMTLGFNIQQINGKDTEFDEITAKVLVREISQTTSAINSNNIDIFYPRVTYGTGPWAYAVAMGDLNSDGLKDVVVTGDLSSVDVFMQNLYGTLDPRVTYAIGSRSIGVAVGDVNRDGKDDVVATNFYAGSISVLTQDSLGTLNPQVTYTVGQVPISVKIGDLNSDGLKDVVVTNWDSDTISVLTQDASGSLNPQVTYSTGSHPWGVAVGDVNGDGIVDVVVGNWGSDTISVYTQTASGKLDSQTTYAGCHAPRGVDIGDVNGDGRNDIVVANGRAGTIGVFVQTSTGELNAMVSYPLTITGRPEGPMYPVVGDVNGDGLNDIVVSIANVFSSPYTVNIFIQNQFGMLEPPFSILASDVGDSRGVAIGDLNGDKRNDLVVADGYNSNTLSVYISKVTPPPPPPVGGYSFQIEGYAPAQPLALYLATIAILTIGFTTIRRKTKIKTK